MTRLAPPIPYATVPRVWDGDTAVVVASGPSLCVDDVEYCRDKAHVIAVKDAIRLAPFAEVLYGCDANFWYGHHGFPDFAGWKYSIDPVAHGHGPALLHNTGEAGLERDPSGLRTGKNSTYQAVNLAVHLGVRRILLLGVDMGHSPHGPKYFYGDRPKGQRVSPYSAMLLLWPTILEPLAALGIAIVNCSRQTALTCLPCRPLREALA